MGRVGTPLGCGGVPLLGPLCASLWVKAPSAPATGGAPGAAAGAAAAPLGGGALHGSERNFEAASKPWHAHHQEHAL